MAFGLGIGLSAPRIGLLATALPSLPPGYAYLTFNGSNLQLDGAYLIVKAQ